MLLQKEREILQKGYIGFRDILINQFYIDILWLLSISLLPNEIMYHKSYHINNNLYELRGTSRHFIAKCIHGGRCMLDEPKITEKRIICLDVVSLYPSAMKILYCLEGIPEGL
jgi:hypothetical protein